MPPAYLSQCYFSETLDDKHPDAHACRLKLYCSLMYVPLLHGDRWPVRPIDKEAAKRERSSLREDYLAYVSKLCHVSQACRLRREEELLLVEHLVKSRSSKADDTTLINRLAPGVLQSASSLRKQQTVLESDHPYLPNEPLGPPHKLAFVNASAIRIDFDVQTATEKKYDYLEFFADVKCTRPAKWRREHDDAWSDAVKRLSGTEQWPPIVIQGSCCYIRFTSDASGEDWGWKFTATPVIAPSSDPSGEEQAKAATIEIALASQEEGGASWTDYVVSHCISGGEGDLQKAAAKEPVWFAHAHCNKPSSSQLRDMEVVRAFDALWKGGDPTGTDGFGYCFLVRALIGNVKLAISGNDCTRSLPSLAARLLVFRKSWTSSNLPLALIAGSCAAGLSMKSVGPVPDIEESVPTYVGNRSSFDGLAKLLKRHAECVLKGKREIETAINDWAGAGYPETSGTGAVTLKPDPTQDGITVSDFAVTERLMRTVTLGNASVTQALLDEMASQPLKGCVDLSRYTQPLSASGKQVSSQLPFDLSGHQDARSELAKETLERLTQGWVLLAKQGASKGFTIAAKDPPVHGALLKLSDSLLGDLHRAHQRELAAVSASIEAILDAARVAPLQAGLKAAETAARQRFHLMQYAGLRAKPRLEHLAALLLSSKAADDLRRLNPHLDAQSIEQVHRATVGLLLRTSRLNQLRESIDAAYSLRTACEGKADKLTLAMRMEHLAARLTARRSYVDVNGAFDPRLLLFEYMFGLLLRQPQVELVATFMARATQGEDDKRGAKTHSLVHQMIMGAGKTTIIGPLLALMLSDGQSLVMQVVPTPLLTMSRTVLWSRFTQCVRKHVYTFDFGRTTPLQLIQDVLLPKLMRARRLGGVIITTPIAIKSVANKFVEVIHSTILDLDALRRNGTGAKGSGKQADAVKLRRAKMGLKSKEACAIGTIMGLWSDRQKGILLIDEVDVLLRALPPLHVLAL